MVLRAYPLLGTTSKRAISRKTTRFGRTYYYSPRSDLLERLQRELGLTKNAAYNLLMEEREHLLKQ
jgi:hypothetical protein